MMLQLPPPLLLLLLLLLSTALMALHALPEEALESEPKEEMTVVAETPAPIDRLTYGNLSQFMDEKGLVVLEFMAPWCGFCRKFQRQFEQVAIELQALEGRPYTCAQVDVEQDPALPAWFDVGYVPAVFVIREGQIWELSKPVSAKLILEFARKGYAAAEPLPWWKSPLSLVGRSKGWFMQQGVQLLRRLPFVGEDFELPDWIHNLRNILLIVALGSFLLCFFLIFLYYPVTNLLSPSAGRAQSRPPAPTPPANGVKEKTQ